MSMFVERGASAPNRAYKEYSYEKVHFGVSIPQAGPLLFATVLDMTWKMCGEWRVVGTFWVRHTWKETDNAGRYPSWDTMT